VNCRNIETTKGESFCHVFLLLSKMTSVDPTMGIYSSIYYTTDLNYILLFRSDIKR